MTTKTNKTAIGAFVLGGILLLIAGVVFFGGGRFFEQTYNVVMRFEGSAVGLKLGAPVIVNGVEVGTVIDIKLEMDLESLRYVTSVTARFRPNLYVTGTEEQVRAVSDRRGQLKPEAARGLLDALVLRGLRAQLAMQSLVTGMMQVELALYPQAPAAELIRLEDDVVEIPTVPSKFAQMVHSLHNMPIDDIVEEVRAALQGIERLVNAPELYQTIEHASAATEKLAALAERMEASFGDLDAELHATLGDARAIMQDLDREYTPLAKEVSEVLEEVKRLAQSLEAQVEPVGTGVALTLDDTRSLLRNELAGTLKALSRASDQLRELTSYLERHPEALLKGKPD